jgi:AAA+ ATPase superfamily predicted ATPase
VRLEFVNRDAEVRELDAAAKTGGVLVLYGRRRVGKTRLLRHWLEYRSSDHAPYIDLA